MLAFSPRAAAEAAAEVEALREQESRDPDAVLTLEGPAHHDFGKVQQGALVEHTFVLKSTGMTPATIQRANTTCGCTVAQVTLEDAGGEFSPYTWGAPIDPGRRVQLTARIATARKIDHVHVRIDVVNNARGGPLQLNLDAQIEPLFVTTPAFLALGDLRPGDTREATLDIAVRSGHPVHLAVLPESRRLMPSGVTVDLVPLAELDAAGRAPRWQVNLRVVAGEKTEQLTFTLCLLSDVLVPDPGKEVVLSEPADKGFPPERYYQVRTTISGRVLGPITLSSPVFLIGAFHPGEALSRSLELVCHEEDFDLSQVEVGLRGEGGAEVPWKDYLGVSVLPVAGAKQKLEVRLDVAALPPDALGPLRGEVWIRTGHPRCAELTARFSGMCK